MHFPKTLLKFGNRQSPHSTEVIYFITFPRICLDHRGQFPDLLNLILSQRTKTFFTNLFAISEMKDHLAQKRSEEHTSELQSRGHLVCRLLLEKKKKQRSIAILV